MRRKNHTKILIILAILLILVLAGGVGYEYLNMKDLSETNTGLQGQIDANTQSVYVATTLISRGDIITDEGDDANVEIQKVATGLEAFNYITEEELGSKAIVDISSGVPIMYNMVSDAEISKDTRDYEVSVVNLMTTQVENDYVDVRISFPTGEDYIVLSKKKITDLNLGNSIFTSQLNEEEILRMTSATIDAYTISGCRLYTTKYVESNLQEDATPNYLVKATTIDLINSDPNILTKATETLNLEARMSLEERLGQITEDDMTSITEGYQAKDDAKASVLTENDEDEAVVDDSTTDTITDTTETTAE